jgi:acyl-CoA synthetase (AMP-forming)/AMP-acid ligase II
MVSTMIDALAATAQNTPNAPYSFYEGRCTTFGELWMRARRVGGALRAFGLQPGERVAYLGKNTDRLIEIIFGAAIARNTCVVLNWRLAMPEWVDIAHDCSATTLFTDHEFIQQARDLADQTGLITRIVAIDLADLPNDPRVVDHDRLVQGNEPIEPHNIQPEDDFLQLYTSGATGKPKGVPQTHAMHLSQRAQWESRIGRFPAGDRFLVFMPFFHAAGITYPLFALQYGTEIEIHRAADPVRIIEALGSGRISSTVVVPTLLAMLVPKIQPGMFPALKRIHYGASAVDRPLLRKAMDVFGCDLVQIYAATETTAALTILTPEDHRKGVANEHLWSSAGKPGAGAQLRIVDAQGMEAPVGQAGEIQVKSASVLTGYWRNEAATREAMNDGWYRTGDLGHLDAEGYCYVVDRVKDMIISGGENVYSSEVENVLAQCPELTEYAVVGAKDPQWGEVVTACVVLKPGQHVNLTQLQDRARVCLAGYKLPRRLEIFEVLPRNPMGKLQKHLLRDQVSARDRAVTAPTSSV